jgi:hypothetical protein
MGHVDDSMADLYRERISDDRLQAVVDHVHDWLFGQADDAAADEGADMEAGDAHEEK